MTTDFGTLGVPYPLVEALAEQGKTSAFPIQVDTLPDTLNGRDVLGRGKTGSGKTLAFAIPMVARIGMRTGARRRPGHPLGLVLAPTRELASQILATIEPLAKAYGLTAMTIFASGNNQCSEGATQTGLAFLFPCSHLLHMQHEVDSQCVRKSCSVFMKSSVSILRYE